jgi:26S proteasome regulatory subunit N2
MDEGEDAKSPADESEEKNCDAMDVEKEVDEEVDEEEKPRKKREPEPLSFSITNPARVTKAQSPYCSFDVNQRYRPIRADESPYGVIMLHDCTPEEEEYIGSVKSPSLEPLGELAPPEPFEWIAPPIPEEEEDDNEEDNDVKEASE